MRGVPLRFFAFVGSAWAVLAIDLSRAPFLRTLLVAVYALAWTARMAWPAVPPAHAVHAGWAGWAGRAGWVSPGRVSPGWVRRALPGWAGWGGPRVPALPVPGAVAAVVLLALVVAAPPAAAASGFRPFPHVSGSYADGALAVASAPVWVHVAVLAKRRTLAWLVPLALALAPAKALLGNVAGLPVGDLPLWPTWLLWGVGFLAIGLVFRLYAALLEREAVAEERRKIAREVHDLVGHGLGVALLNIGAARLAATRGDAAATATALEEAERAARQSVRDIHQGLVLLRAGPAPESPPPALPAAADIPALLDEVRAGGLKADLTTEGDLESIPPAIGLALYRVIQESLSNTARHAPGAAATVTLTTTPTHTTATITDHPPHPPAPAPPGLGLRGMRERVTALGGTLRAAPSTTGWLVEAVVPTPRGRS